MPLPATFDLRFACTGHFDVELSTRFWLDGRYSVGLYYPGVGNGVGGHKTRIGKQGRLRRRNQKAAFAHLWSQWRTHNGTIGAQLTSENGQLLMARPAMARALQQARPETQVSCGGKG